MGRLVVKLDALENIIRKNKLIGWYISCSDADNRIYEYDKDLSFDENVTETLETLKNEVEDGLYNFYGKKTESSRGAFNFLVRVGQSNDDRFRTQNNQTPQIAQINGYTEDELQARITGAITEYENRRKIEELEKELKQLKEKEKEFEGFKVEVLKKISPFIEPVLKGVVSGIMGRVSGQHVPGPAHQIHGYDTENEESKKKTDMINTEEQNYDLQLDEQEELRLYKVIETLRTAEPTAWLSMLEKVADMAKNNTDTYQMARKFLI